MSRKRFEISTPLARRENFFRWCAFAGRLLCTTRHLRRPSRCWMIDRLEMFISSPPTHFSRPLGRHAFAIKNLHVYEIQFWRNFSSRLRVFGIPFVRAKNSRLARCRWIVQNLLIIRKFNFLSWLLVPSLASSRFSHVRLMSFTSIPRRSGRGSPRRRRPSVSASSTTRRGTCIGSSRWREQRWVGARLIDSMWVLIVIDFRLLSTRRLRPTWHSHRHPRSLDSGATFALTPFMVSLPSI